MNMSYCRFENTSSDLEDCIEAVKDSNSIEDLKEGANPEEAEAVDALYEFAKEFIELYEAR